MSTDYEKYSPREWDESSEDESFWKDKKPTWAERIMNNIIWGNHPFNPNNIDIASDDNVWKKSGQLPKGILPNQPY